MILSKSVESSYGYFYQEERKQKDCLLSLNDDRAIQNHACESRVE